jgi:DNA uptake protein ComE-like DNA-binding protein
MSSVNVKILIAIKGLDEKKPKLSWKYREKNGKFENVDIF